MQHFKRDSVTISYRLVFGVFPKNVVDPFANSERVRKKNLFLLLYIYGHSFLGVIFFFILHSFLTLYDLSNGKHQEYIVIFASFFFACKYSQFNVQSQSNKHSSVYINLNILPTDTNYLSKFFGHHPTIFFRVRCAWMCVFNRHIF